ncbi:MAG: PD-(D/E)XK nuclease family protein [Victivallaceae bacterium]
MVSIQEILLKITNRIAKIKIEQEAFLKATHGRFNLFSTLLKVHDEVRLHSRFLEFLLNPSSNHDCGALFLQLFLDTIKEDISIILHNDHENSLELILSDFKKDKFCWGGTEYKNIDIYLEFKRSKLAIENKIYADEQPKQIERYANEIGKQGLILFLTLFGRKATTHHGKRYVCISYKHHILPWLNKCLAATYEYININQALQQYKKIVQQLTNTLENKEMNQIIEVVKSHPEIIKYNKDISAGIEAVKREWLDSFWEGLKINFKKQNIELGGWYPDKNCEYSFSDQYVEVKIKNEPIKIYFLLEINFADKVLKAGLGTHTYPEPIKETIFEEIKRGKYYEELSKAGCSWWPLGSHVIKDRFANDSFIAENYHNVEDLAKECTPPILEYINDVRKHWNTNDLVKGKIK